MSDLILNNVQMFKLCNLVMIDLISSKIEIRLGIFIPQDFNIFKYAD